VVGDRVNGGGARAYPQPEEAAKQIAGYVAFWEGAGEEK
jgi:uncharacterized protein (DUF427 family)